MPYSPKPYVSAALAHLRHGVTVAALAVGVAAAAQLLIFGCVHFTQVRFEEPRREAPAPLSVVSAPRQVSAAKETETGPPVQPVGPAMQPSAGASNVALPRALSGADATLHTACDAAVIVGVFGMLSLAALSLLGVVVAGGASVPGVERAVSAASYALLMGLACVPWRDVFPSMPFPGVFGGYETMTEMSGAVDAGAHAGPLFTMYLAMPAAAMVGSLLVLARFRAGVADGVIATSVSELDERLEREMASIRARGVTANSPRAVAALHQAIGEKPGDAVAEAEAAVPEPAPVRRAPAGVPRSARSGLGRERRMGEADPGDPLKRPI
jgi:hypothetical protein